MMNNTEKGVSLIALIITIAVIVIIATITVQKGLQRTDDAKISKHNQDIAAIQEEVQEYYYYKGGELPIQNSTPYNISSISTLESEIIKNGETGDAFYAIDFSKLGKTAGDTGGGSGNDIYIVSGNRHNVYYVKGDIIKSIVYHGYIGNSTISLTNLTDGKPNSPKLGAGMTAVKWNGSSWINANVTNNNNDWYDYSVSSNKWANVKLTDGSLFVWIPRYTYKIVSGEHSSTQGRINIRFSSGINDDITGGYRVHPAFYWGGWTIPANSAMTKQAGGTELTGIWIGKFEPRNNGGMIQVISNATGWNNISVDNMFTACRAMQTTNSLTYGISPDTTVIDTHMMKNSEWGAAAYLAKYALGSTEVAINSNGSYLTANGDIVTNKAQSTTGNEYGIYDMSGCCWEYVCAYIDNLDSHLTTYGNSIVIAANKYKDKLPVAATDVVANNYPLLDQAYGHAIFETSSNTNTSNNWFKDIMFYAENQYPYFARGGMGVNATGAGLFALGNNWGSAVPGYGFRVVCVVP